MNIYLIEYYVNSGFEINLAWVKAIDEEFAVEKLRAKVGRRFDEVITITQTSGITDLGSPADVIE